MSNNQTTRIANKTSNISKQIQNKTNTKQRTHKPNKLSETIYQTQNTKA